MTESVASKTDEMSRLVSRYFELLADATIKDPGHESREALDQFWKTNEDVLNPIKQAAKEKMGDEWTNPQVSLGEKMIVMLDVAEHLPNKIS